MKGGEEKLVWQQREKKKSSSTILLSRKPHQQPKPNYKACSSSRQPRCEIQPSLYAELTALNNRSIKGINLLKPAKPSATAITTPNLPMSSIWRISNTRPNRHHSSPVSTLRWLMNVTASPNTNVHWATPSQPCTSSTNSLAHTKPRHYHLMIWGPLGSSSVLAVSSRSRAIIPTKDPNCGLLSCTSVRRNKVKTKKGKKR